MMPAQDPKLINDFGAKVLTCYHMVKKGDVCTPFLPVQPVIVVRLNLLFRKNGGRKKICSVVVAREILSYIDLCDW